MRLVVGQVLRFNFVDNFTEKSAVSGRDACCANAVAVAFH